MFPSLLRGCRSLGNVQYLVNIIEHGPKLFQGFHVIPSYARNPNTNKKTKEAIILWQKRRFSWSKFISFRRILSQIFSTKQKKTSTWSSGKIQATPGGVGSPFTKRSPNGRLSCAALKRDTSVGIGEVWCIYDIYAGRVYLMANYLDINCLFQLDDGQPNLYMKNWCFTKHPIKNCCYQVYNNVML